MKKITSTLFLVTAGLGIAAAANVYDFPEKSIDQSPASLTQYKGKVLLIVNTASLCGYTPQYAGLEELYRKHKDQGFVIVGFPANNFGQQEPGTNAEIKTFCKRKYDVTFPMMSKISVGGSDIDPLYKYLTDEQSKTGGPIKWNFTKFLISRDGKVLARFEPAVTPGDPMVESAVEKALK
jgi:glutathione peroxidase